MDADDEFNAYQQETVGLGKPKPKKKKKKKKKATRKESHQSIGRSSHHSKYTKELDEGLHKLHTRQSNMTPQSSNRNEPLGSNPFEVNHTHKSTFEKQNSPRYSQVSKMIDISNVQLDNKLELDPEDDEEEHDGEDVEKHGKKIIYRVANKMNSDMYDISTSKGVRCCRKCCHCFTTFLMVVGMLATMAIYLMQLIKLQMNNYEVRLARASIVDPSITNQVVTISVVRYFLIDTKEDSSTAANTVYTNYTTICGSSRVYLEATQVTLEQIQTNMSSPYMLFCTSFTFLLMFVCIFMVLLVSIKKFKVHQVPLILRSINVGMWTYIQRFKILLYIIFISFGSFFAQLNLYNADSKCLECYGENNCLYADQVQFAMITMGLFILVPIFLMYILNTFYEMLRYVCLPIILVNIFFTMIISILAHLSIVYFFRHTSLIPNLVIHAYNYATILLIFSTFVINKIQPDLDR